MRGLDPKGLGKKGGTTEELRLRPFVDEGVLHFTDLELDRYWDLWNEPDKDKTGGKSDLSPVTELWLDLVRHHVEQDGRIPAVVEGGAEKWKMRLEKSLDDPTCQLYVAEEEREHCLLGFATGFLRYSADVFENQVAGKIADVYVAPDWRRQGVAHRLVSALTRWFREQGANHIEMNLVTSNPEAVGFWQGVGAQDFMRQMWLPLDWQEK